MMGTLQGKRRGRSNQDGRPMRYYKGYAISGLIGLFVGIFATTWVTHAVPKMISTTVLNIMTGMMGLMKEKLDKKS